MNLLAIDQEPQDPNLNPPPQRVQVIVQYILWGHKSLLSSYYIGAWTLWACSLPLWAWQDAQLEECFLPRPRSSEKGTSFRPPRQRAHDSAKKYPEDLNNVGITWVEGSGLALNPKLYNTAQTRDAVNPFCSTLDLREIAPHRSRTVN